MLDGDWSSDVCSSDLCLPSPAPATSSLTSGDDLDDTAHMNAFTATNPAPCAASQTLASNCASNKGWFMNLNNGTGEQTVTSAVISGGMVTFSTNRPIPAATGTCSSALGEARGYWLDLFKGSGAIETSNNATCGGVASKAFVGGGFPPSPIIGTVSVNGVPVTVIIGAIQKSGTVSSAIAPQKASATNLPARRRVYTIIKGEN
jgi:type IV pilus assembly protein PilY1